MEKHYTMELNGGAGFPMFTFKFTEYGEQADKRALFRAKAAAECILGNKVFALNLYSNDKLMAVVRLQAHVEY